MNNMRMIYWGFNLPFVFLMVSSRAFILHYTDIFWHVFSGFSFYLGAVGPRPSCVCCAIMAIACCNAVV